MKEEKERSEGRKKEREQKTFLNIFGLIYVYDAQHTTEGAAAARTFMPDSPHLARGYK